MNSTVEAVPKLDEAHPPSKIPVSVGRPSLYEDIEISNIRSVIAKRLGESKVQYYDYYP